MRTRCPSFFLPVFALAAALSALPAWALDFKLSGSQEVPPVDTSADGRGTIDVASDGAVAGTLTTSNMTGTAAHIHHGAAGKNGPVVVHFTKTGDNTWSVVRGARLTPDQLRAYRAGELYVNVHSPAYKDGEVRAQLIP
ncbi:MAG: CHRD domain-containing protein [Pseudomonadota bacterium]